MNETVRIAFTKQHF